MRTPIQQWCLNIIQEDIVTGIVGRKVLPSDFNSHESRRCLFFWLMEAGNLGLAKVLCLCYTSSTGTV